MIVVSDSMKRRMRRNSAILREWAVARSEGSQKVAFCKSLGKKLGYNWRTINRIINENERSSNMGENSSKERA